MLDYPLNDIFLHIDKKAKITQSDIKQLSQSIKHSKLVLVKRIRVVWGSPSQIKTELLLLKAALSSQYSYYHLLSGLDLPLYSQETIHRFFLENSGKEYIRIQQMIDSQSVFVDRICYYHFFQNLIGKRLIQKRESFDLIMGINSKLLWIQKKIGINRIKHSKITFYKGTNWFSITNQMAEYIINHYSDVKKYMKYSILSDEIFLQTLAMNSPLAHNITNTTMRLIDWERGCPYTFRSEDYNEIIDSDALFASKFDETIDNKIINRIHHDILGLSN